MYLKKRRINLIKFAPLALLLMLLLAACNNANVPTNSQAGIIASNISAIPTSSTTAASSVTSVPTVTTAPSATPTTTTPTLTPTVAPSATATTAPSATGTPAPSVAPTATKTTISTTPTRSVPATTPTAAKTTPTATTSKPTTPAQAQAIIASRSSEVIAALKNKDMAKLATFVDLTKGVRFSAYSYVTQNDRLFNATQIKTLLNDKNKYKWGVYDGKGDPINLTFAEYYTKFVYSHNFASAPKIGYNQIIGTGNTTENSAKFYPNSIVVEYHFPGFDPQYSGMDWKSLRLAFQETKGVWYLVGIIHDEWTI